MLRGDALPYQPGSAWVWSYSQAGYELHELPRQTDCNAFCLLQLRLSSHTSTSSPDHPGCGGGLLCVRGGVTVLSRHQRLPLNFCTARSSSLSWPPFLRELSEGVWVTGIVTAGGLGAVGGSVRGPSGR